MTWLNSPKRIVRLLSIAIATGLFLFLLLPILYNNTPSSITAKYSDVKSDEDLSINLEKKEKSQELNTVWDDVNNPWVLKNSVYNASTDYLSQLKSYTTKGHDYNTLFVDSPVSKGPTTVSVLFPIYSKDSLQKIDSVLSWSPTLDTLSVYIHIVCSSQFKPELEEKLTDLHNVKLTVMDRSTTGSTATTFAVGTAGASIWLQLIGTEEFETDYVYILDEKLPAITAGSFLDELDYLFRTNQLDDYKNTLMGTKALVFNPNRSTGEKNFCLPVTKVLPTDMSQPADMLLGGWLLQTSWLPFATKDTALESLKLPLGYYFSMNLQNQLNIPTIALPPPSTDLAASMTLSKIYCEEAELSWESNADWREFVSKNRFISSLQYRQLSEPAALIVAQGSKQVIALYPLLCRFTKYPVHLVLLGDDVSSNTVKNALLETGCSAQVQIHDFSKQKNQDTGLGYLIKTIKPEVMIQIKNDQPQYYAIQSMANANRLVEIGLPENDIVHALWIPDLPLKALKNWNKIQIKLVVITDRRPHSLSRLLQSASKSVYLGDKADLIIHMEQSADRVTRMLVNSFVWRQGIKTIRHRIRKGGLMPAIVESWYPSNNDEYAVLLEDDIEVSTLFYIWTKYSILKYRYSGNREAYKSMYGISLYAPRNLELVPAGRVTFDPNSVLLPAGYPEHMPYASQIPCSWGGVYFPEQWREFHAYLVRRLKDLTLPKDHKFRLISVPGSRSDKWKKSWKKYFIEMVYLRASVMLYPNFQDFEAFSTNHVEFGTHVKSEKRQSVIGTFMVPLMQRDTILSQLPNASLPQFEDLPVLDLWGQLQSLEILESIASKYHKHVSTCSRTFGTFDPSEFFCRVDGPPDPLQEFPMSPKQPKPPVLVKDVVQPIKYHHITEYTEEEEEEARTEMLEFGPKPIDVAQMPVVEEHISNRDDEMLDLEKDLDTLHHLFLQLNRVTLDDSNDEQVNMEENDVEDLNDDQDDLE